MLGEGGTGIVYDAIRTSDGSPVALKVMHAQLAGDQQIRGRFQREADDPAAARGRSHLPDPRARRGARSEATARALLYMALPKLEGPTLEHVLEKERPDRGRARARRHARDLRRAADRARAGRHPSRSQARERDPREREEGGRRRLRDVEDRHRRGAAARRTSPRTTWSSGRPSTCRRSRRAATSSTRAATSTPPASCSTRCSRARRPSPARRRSTSSPSTSPGVLEPPSKRARGRAA